MAHRDDRDAMRARLDALSAELASTTGELEERERELDAATRRTKELEREVESLRVRAGLAPTRPTPRATALVTTAAVVLLLAGVGAGVFVVMVSRAPAPSVVTDAPPVYVPPTPPPPPPPPPATPPFAASWPARVVSSEGAAPAAEGADCVVEATVAGTSLETTRVTVTCGEQTVYSTEQPEGAGMTSYSSAVAEHPGDELGTSRFELVHTDAGTRSGGRPLATLASWEPFSAVTSPDGSLWRMRLSLEPLSELLPTTPFSRGSRGYRTYVHRSGSVAESSGPGALEVGTPCDLVIRPNAGGSYDCRLRVLCGERVLYGAGTSGYDPCGATPGVVNDPRDDDGDPALALDLAVGSIEITDGASGTQARTLIALEPAEQTPPP